MTSTEVATFLKVSSDRPALRREAEALRLLGPDCVRLVEDRGDALLIELVEPGSCVADLPDEESTAVLARCLLRLWVPVPGGCGLPTVEHECAPLADPAATARLPGRLLSAAVDELARLLADPPPPVVLHGDLHHGNLLLSAGGTGPPAGWVAIDPHGVVGDPGYDVGPMLINPMARIGDTADLAGLTARRLDILSDVLGLDRDRLRGWGLVRCLLSEAWLVQSAGAPDGRPLRLAEVLVG